MDFCFDLFFIQEKSRVEKAFAFVQCISCRAANEYADGIGFLANQVNSIVTFIDKIAELNKIPGRVTAYAHFGEHNQIAALSFGFSYGLNDLIRIAFKISDMVILLR
jgi:hypothetical protein